MIEMLNQTKLKFLFKDYKVKFIKYSYRRHSRLRLKLRKKFFFQKMLRSLNCIRSNIKINKILSNTNFFRNNEIFSSGITSANNFPLTTVQNKMALLSISRFKFARQKKPFSNAKIQLKFEEELNRQFNQIKQKKQVNQKKYNSQSRLRFIGKLSVIVIAFSILQQFTSENKKNKRKRNAQKTSQNGDMNNSTATSSPLQEQDDEEDYIEGNFSFIPEPKLRQIIGSGAIARHRVIIVRKYNKKVSHYQNYCLVKTITGQSFISSVINLHDLLAYVESLEQTSNLDIKVKFQYQHHVEHASMVSKYFNMIFLGFIVVMTIYLRRKYAELQKNNPSAGSGLDFDTKKIQAIKPEKINTLFKDVAGMHQAKFQITQFVDFLKSPEKYIDMGAKVPKGALLTGPPGTGKTLLARACAGQADVPFYYVSGSDFVEKYVGLGAKRVRSLFDEAQKNAPSIIFIDQIDAIGKKRDSGPFANEERDNTLNQLLVRMDGFDTKNKVIVMAATNIKDALDPALLRPGRFDRSVEIGLPNFEERKQILQVHLQKVKFNPELTIEQVANRIAILTPGFSGAQLANVCNQAAILAARDNMQFIEMAKFEKATERVMAGLQKRNLFSDDEKIMLAYYECGKAVVGWFTEGSDPIIKLSILPFSKASKGYSHTIRDQVALNTKEQLLGKVCYFLAGRASEDYFQKYVTTNGDSDLKRAKRIISLLVTKFGMSQRLKHIAFPDIEFVRKPYSSKVESIIDEEIDKITYECKEKVEKIIAEKSELIEKLKQKLLEKETLTHNEIKAILGDRPFEETNENYQKYILEEERANKNQESAEGVGQLNEKGPLNSKNLDQSKRNKLSSF